MKSPDMRAKNECKMYQLDVPGLETIALSNGRTKQVLLASLGTERLPTSRIAIFLAKLTR